MPTVVGIIHGMAMPMANSTEAATTGSLRRPMKSEIGPATIEPPRETIMMITDMVAMAAPAATSSRPTYFWKMSSW